MDQLQHKQLMLSWNDTIDLMLGKQMIAQDLLPVEWLTAINTLMSEEKEMAEGGLLAVSHNTSFQPCLIITSGKAQYTSTAVRLLKP
ncbi:hypothetical protein PCASD_12375 [Puccinia coronata f. sp. avenae]|uniref:Uncharacterized protein n=1 Tax=Puccinia coronata f. sp. avenae TaxID=200324 RepID=A0A2N5TDP5_9BASI|nr:hypothetical protein PCASD_12375 [Puccinia coronata f. sp. avenae]